MAKTYLTGDGPEDGGRHGWMRRGLVWEDESLREIAGVHELIERPHVIVHPITPVKADVELYAFNADDHAKAKTLLQPASKAAGGRGGHTQQQAAPSGAHCLGLSRDSHTNALPSQKRHYRQRAHANPFSDHALDYPASPALMDWDVHYPAFAGSEKTPEFADVGCGFGGLLIALAPLFPDTLMLGKFVSIQ